MNCVICGAECEGTIAWIVCKATRVYTNGPGYGGPAYEKAGLPWKPFYWTQTEAEAVAKALSAVNPVGFEVLTKRWALCTQETCQITAKEQIKLAEILA